MHGSTPVTRYLHWHGGIFLLPLLCVSVYSTGYDIPPFDFSLLHISAVCERCKNGWNSAVWKQWYEQLMMLQSAWSGWYWRSDIAGLSCVAAATEQCRDRFTTRRNTASCESPVLSFTVALYNNCISDQFICQRQHCCSNNCHQVKP